MGTINARHGFRAVLLAALALGGCAGSVSDVVVPIDAAAIVHAAPAASRVTKLEIADIRHHSAPERTTIGGISMGRITFAPPEVELVRTIVTSGLDAALARPGVAAPAIVYCGIRAFDVTTPATPLYWDVTTAVEIVLRVGGQDRVASGKAVERTFAWPSPEIIQRVTIEALKQVARESEQALAVLLAGPR